MGIKQHNGNTKADRLAELKIRSPSIQLIGDAANLLI